MKRANNRSDTWCFNTSERKESKGRKVGEANARPVCHIIQVLLGYGCTSNNHSKRFEIKAIKKIIITLDMIHGHWRTIEPG